MSLLSRSRDDIASRLNAGRVRYIPSPATPPPAPHLETPPPAPVTSAAMEVGNSTALTRITPEPRSPLQSSATPPRSPSSSFVVLRQQSGEDPQQQQQQSLLADGYIMRLYQQGHPMPPETQILNPDTEIFGMDGLRRLLHEHILMPQLAPQFFMAAGCQPGRFLRVQGPMGAGVRTFCINWGRVNRINIVTLAPMVGNKPYSPGTYRELMRLVVCMQPCLVLLDRMDDHWGSALFHQSGAELIQSWQWLLEQQHPALPSIWFLMSSDQPITAMHPQLLEHWVKHRFCNLSPLLPANVLPILLRAFGIWLHYVGMQSPALEQKLQHYRAMLEKVAARLAQHALRTTPALIHNFVSWMFQSALSRRFMAQPEQLQRFSVMSAQEAALQDDYLRLRLPDDADFEDAVSKLPFQLFK